MHDASRNYLDKHKASGRPVHSLFLNAVFVVVFVCNVYIQVEAHVLWHVCGSQSPSSGTQRHFYPLSCSLLLCAPHLITMGLDGSTCFCLPLAMGILTEITDAPCAPGNTRVASW